MLEDRDLEISHVLLTHWHGDHTGGIPDLLARYPELNSRIYKCSPDFGQNPIEDGQIFETKDATLRAVFTPGHAFDHMCFVLEEENSIFTGDNVLGHGYTVVEDLAQYLDSLQYMSSQHCVTGYPGHGAVITSMPIQLSNYVRHRKLRERQVQMALSKSTSDRYNPSGPGGALTVSQLVSTIHGEVTRDLFEEVLSPSVTEILWMMARERKVGFRIRRGDREWFMI